MDRLLKFPLPCPYSGLLLLTANMDLVLENKSIPDFARVGVFVCMICVAGYQYNLVYIESIDGHFDR